MCLRKRQQQLLPRLRATIIADPPSYNGVRWCGASPLRRRAIRLSMHATVSNQQFEQ
jgi:hypothetical protein